jgi:hypothetical protein
MIIQAGAPSILQAEGQPLRHCVDGALLCAVHEQESMGGGSKEVFGES